MSTEGSVKKEENTNSKIQAPSSRETSNSKSQEGNGASGNGASGETSSSPQPSPRYEERESRMPNHAPLASPIVQGRRGEAAGNGAKAKLHSPSSVELPEAEPWPEVVDGKELLGAIMNELQRFV